MFSDRRLFATHVQSIIQTQGGTCFYNALAAAYQVLEKNPRPFCRKTIILQTDGEDGGQDTSSLVRSLLLNGYSIIAIAVGNGANTAALARITGDRNKVIAINNYAMLDKYIDTIASACAAS